MRKQMAKILTAVLLLGTLTNVSTAKAAAPKLNKSKLTLYIGSNYTLKVKKASGKVKWTSGKKSVATVSSKGKVVAKKAGKAKITAKIGSKKLICRLTVKKRPLGKGTKASPKSAYNNNSFTFYEEGKKIGKISMQLESFASGAESAKLAKKNSSNLVPKSNEEYLYFRFKITYHSGTQTIKAKDVFNYYYNIFGANSTKQMTNLDWGFFFEDVDDLGQVLLSPGNTITCGKAVLINKGFAPYTYRIQTGKNTYSWFTTAR